MKNFLLPALVVCFASCYSQEIQKEINAQVWLPFIETFNARNTEGFMAVHSKDLVRSSRDEKRVYNYEQYKKQNEQGDQRSKSKRTIDLHFLERLASENQAYEVGIYKTTMINSNGESRSFYGKFHVVMRKEKGVWKILVDSDSSENGTIGEKDFLEAKPLQ